MKNFLIIAFLSVGLFTVSNAQILTYNIVNESSEVWDFSMIDSGGSAEVNELDIIPTGTRNGTVGNPPLTPWELPLTIKGVNSNGCGATMVLVNPGAGNIDFVCSSTAEFKYRLLFDGDNYTLQIRFD